MKEMVLLPIDILLKGKFVQLFGRGRGSSPVAERIGDSAISLPLYPRLKDHELDYVIASVREIVTANA